VVIHINVPAHSYKAIAFSLPYTGSVTVNANVAHGNPMDIFVVNRNQTATLRVVKFRNMISI
jgi:hypothetical protein